jgi:membrane-associated phospholipid phosphatase
MTETYARQVTWFDTNLSHWTAIHRFPVGDHAARGIMAAGSSPVILGGAALFCLLFVVVRRRYRLATGVVLAVVAATLISELLKQFIGRARPPASMALVHASGLSMPSTDAALTSAAAAALYVGLTRLSSRSRRLAAGLLAAAVIAVGLCLVYLGVHWATDVLAGWALGTAVGAGAAAVTTPRWRQLALLQQEPRG